MELNREQIIDEIDTKIKYAKFVNTDAVILSSKAAQFCLEHAQYYEQKIKELTEENERLRADVIAKEAEYDDMLHQRNSVEQHLETVKADTVRKFAERLKKYYSILNSSTNSNLVAYHIDQVAKEMLEDDENGT